MDSDGWDCNSTMARLKDYSCGMDLPSIQRDIRRMSPNRSESGQCRSSYQMHGMASNAWHQMHGIKCGMVAGRVVKPLSQHPLNRECPLQARSSMAFGTSSPMHVMRGIMGCLTVQL
jgi:hypothetical protein